MFSIALCLGGRRQAELLKAKEMILDLKQYPLTSSKRLALRVSIPLNMRKKKELVEAIETAFRLHMIFVGLESETLHLHLKRLGMTELREIHRLYRAELRGEYGDYLKDDDSD